MSGWLGTAALSHLTDAQRNIASAVNLHLIAKQMGTTLLDQPKKLETKRFDRPTPTDRRKLTLASLSSRLLSTKPGGAPLVYFRVLF